MDIKEFILEVAKVEREIGSEELAESLENLDFKSDSLVNDFWELVRESFIYNPEQHL